jgi:PAS domain S-box-containing protein
VTVRPAVPSDVRTAGRAVVESIGTSGVLIANADLTIVRIEGEVFAPHCDDPDAWLGRRLSEVLPSEVVAELEPRYSAALTGVAQSFDYWSVDGRTAYWVQIAPVRDEAGTVGLLVLAMQDVTERLQTTAALARSNARLRESERLVGVGSWELSLPDEAITFSDGFGRLVGLAAGTPLDITGYYELVHPEDRARLRQAVEDCETAGSASCEHRLMRPGGGERTLFVQGELVTDDDGSRYLRGATLDVTQERISALERFEALSLFQQGFDAAPIGMILSDPVSGRYLRVNEAMCRLVGRSEEELLAFPVDAVTHPDEQADDARARQAMLDGTVSHVHTDKRYVRSDGTAVWASLHASPVRRADGETRVFFSQVIDITERKEREARLARDGNDAVWLRRLRDAIDQDRLELFSQPIVDLRTGETVQHELLLRMRDENGSIILPGTFLPVAERYGLIGEIDRWVIRRAAGIAATGTPVQFNLSATSICDPDVVRAIEAAIAAAGANPSLLIVEVTETAIVGNVDVGRIFAERVTALGCELALDDFGTGFGSLSHLRQIPAQHLKIDIEFVRDLTGADADERVVRGIVGLAAEFDQTTTAEGVEDHATLERLRELGVHRAQGYLLGHPSPLEDS